MFGMNEFDSSDLIADGNSEFNSLEFEVLFVCSTKISRSALRFVGEVGSVIVVVYRDSFLEQISLL